MHVEVNVLARGEFGEKDLTDVLLASFEGHAKRVGVEIVGVDLGLGEEPKDEVAAIAMLEDGVESIRAQRSMALDIKVAIANIFFITQINH